MKGFGGPVYSHLSDDDEGRLHTNTLIRMSTPKRITSYPKLVRTVARIQYYNPEYSLFFRGQSQDFELDTGASTMYPSIFRSPNDTPLRSDELDSRMERLEGAEALLLEKFKENNLEGHDKLSEFKELCWAILQHYEVCDTPLLDITSSLQAAASFALRHDPKTGILYVLGFPHINGSISYYVDKSIINIKLLSICPPEAQRPFFQEGFLVGTFPTKLTQKHPSLDVACRVIAKFRVGWGTPGTWDFWGKHFSPIPEGALFPDDDRVKRMCDQIKAVI